MNGDFVSRVMMSAECTPGQVGSRGTQHAIASAFSRCNDASKCARVLRVVGVAVPQFMITCPVANQLVSTGVEAIDDIAAGPIGRMAARMKCHACGKEHIWTMRGARIGESWNADDFQTTQSKVARIEQQSMVA